MPSGYTAKLYEGPQSYRDFVLQCSKTFFGYFRENFDAKHPASAEEIMGDDLKRCEKRLREAEAERDESLILTFDDAKRRLMESHQRELKRYENEKPILDARAKRFLDMYARVKKIDDSRSEFVANLKKFMLHQLSYDLPKPGEDNGPPKPSTDEEVAKYIEDERVMRVRMVHYAEKDLADMRENIQKTDVALDELRELAKEE